MTSEGWTVDSDPQLPGTQAPTLPAIEGTPASLPSVLRLGSYTISGVLGEGSMGVVYRAVQDRPHRVVALKVVRAGAASPAALRRFEHETQILGRLQHPGIAQIFEAGVAETGYGARPFFAMELIQGVPLDLYAEKEALSPRERLALMAKVCAGVQHAHQKGVIHRDLKPGNILVDETGRPKILDFGIAVGTEQDLGATASQGGRRQLAGTVPYMSLEQLKGDPQEVDTRTDVYALGVITYQLLARRLPYDLQGASIAEAVRLVEEQQPTALGHFSKAFRGDIETIVHKSLEKDKTRRYQSASDLGEDIRRFLANEPVLAHQPSAIYQFRKFAGRNKALAGGVVAVFVCLVVGILGTGWGMIEARLQARIAQAASEFVTDDLLARADPLNEPNRDITLREVLDRASDKVEEKFRDQPLVQASIRRTLGKTYRGLGMYDAAEPHLLAAQEINREIRGEHHAETLKSMNELSHSYHAQGKLVAAEKLYRQTLEAQLDLLGDEHIDTLETMHNRATVLRDLGRLGEAESLYRQVVQTQRRVLGDEHLSTLIASNNLALLLKMQGKPSEAEVWYRQTLASCRRTLRDEHPSTLTAMKNLAVLLKSQNKLTEAGRYYRQVLETERRVLGDEHPNTLISMSNLASLLHRQGKLDEAEDLYRKTVGRFRRNIGDRNPAAITTISGLAALLFEKGDYAEGELLWREAIGLWREVLPVGHPRIANYLIRLGMLLVRKGEAARAEPLLRECLDIRRNTLDADDWRTANAESALGECLTLLGRFEEGEPLLAGSYSVMKDKLGESDSHTHRALERAIKLYETWGKPGEAARYRELMAMERTEQLATTP